MEGEREERREGGRKDGKEEERVYFFEVSNTLGK